MEMFYIILAILVGTATPVQSGINAQLQLHWAQSTVVAALASFATGTIALFIITMATRTTIPLLSGNTTSWWHWTGGLLGAFFVASMAFLAPKLGAVTMMTLVLLGQVGICLVLDQFGLFGYAQKNISLPQIAGVVLVIAGVYIIRRF